MRIIFLVAVLLTYLYKPALALEFTIGSPVVTGNEITVVASMSAASSNYYLQGAMRGVESSEYFGETKNLTGSWIDYVSSPEKEYIASNFLVTDVKEASWSGTVAVRFKTDDTNYRGPGTYELKLRRFTGNSSSSAGDSNVITISLNEPLPVSSPSPSPTPTPTPSPVPVNPTPSPIPSPRPSPISVIPSAVPSLESPRVGTVAGQYDIDLSAYRVASSQAASESSNRPELSPHINRERAKILIIIGGGLIIVSVCSFFLYRKYHYSRKIEE